MKKRILQIGSLVMALVVLFVSMGWDVNALSETSFLSQRKVVSL